MKAAILSLAAAAGLTLSAGTASAQPGFYGNHHHHHRGYFPGGYYGPVGRPVVVAPVVPVVPVAPVIPVAPVAPVYGSGFSLSVTPRGVGFGAMIPFSGGYGNPGYGGYGNPGYGGFGYPGGSYRRW